jgi:L-arabinonolactonase
MTQAGRAGCGLRWDAQGQRWWWADPLGDQIHAWAGPQLPHFSARLQDSVATVACCRSGKLLLGLGKRLAVVEPPASASRSISTAPSEAGAGGRPLATQLLTTIDAAEPRTSISDGRTDRAGNFVFGTANTAPDRRPIGSFYQYSRQHGVRRLALPVVVVASSICFSVDGSRMYFGDAVRGDLLQCRYDAARAKVSEIGVFAAGADPRARMHGAVVDRDDAVWLALDGAATVRQYGPDGVLRRQIALDCEPPANLAFGGAAMDQLLLLAANGRLLALSAAGATGLADTLYDDADRATAVEALAGTRTK